MSGSFHEETLERRRLAPLTVDQYEEMAEHGIIPSGSPIELLDGLLVRKDRAKAGDDPMTIGTEHQTAVDGLQELLPRLLELGCYLRIQGPIRLPPGDEPEPDGAIVTGHRRDYARRHPESGDVHCVIEVSDSSLETDRTTKLRIYARAGIGQYVIVNLVDRVVEVYTSAREGRYARKLVRSSKQTIALRVGSRRVLKVKASELLP